MIVTVAPTQSDIQVVLRSFLVDILPAATPIFAGQGNRVPEPAQVNFVDFTAQARTRLATNTDSFVDAEFTGSIAATTLTVTEVAFGALAVGHAVYGVGVVDGTTVTLQLTGDPGGVGTYTVSETQTISAETLAAGVADLLQSTMVDFQINVHGPAAADNAQIISTAFRDEYAVEFFAGLSSTVTPLYADDPKQIPFINDQQQYEDRWVIQALVQADQTVVVGQQFASAVGVTPVNVDVAYPPEE